MALTFSATTLRTDGFIALARLLQFILAIVVIGLVGSGIPSWNDAWGCSIPSSMNYMVAIGILTMFYTIYLGISTCISRASFLWHPYAQLGLDGLFLVFWIAVCAVAKPTCTQLADACATRINDGYFTSWSNLYIWYTTYDNGVVTWQCLTNGDSTTNIKRLSTSSATKGTSSSIKLMDELLKSQGVGAVVVLLFAFTLGFGIYRFIQDKRKASVSSNSGQAEPLAAEDKNAGPQDTVREVSRQRY